MLLCLPSSFLQGMQGKNTCEILSTQKRKRGPRLTCCSDFWGFSVLSCGTNCCVASFSLVVYRHQLFSSYPCTSAKNHRCGNLGHCDFSQLPWQKDSWLQRSEASLNMKKALLSVFFLCKGSCSCSPQSSVSTLSWNPLCSVVLLLFRVNRVVCTTAAHYPGFSSAAELHLFSGVYSLKNVVAISRKPTETRSVGLVFYFRYYVVLQQIKGIDYFVLFRQVICNSW